MATYPNFNFGTGMEGRQGKDGEGRREKEEKM